MAEVAALMTNDKYNNYVDELRDYEGQIVRVAEALKNNEIDPAQYEAAMEEIYDGIYKNLEALQELDQAMMHYYGDTIVAS
jgi:uncharacterized protein (UPF0305 family)